MPQDFSLHSYIAYIADSGCLSRQECVEEMKDADLRAEMIVLDHAHHQPPVDALRFFVFLTCETRHMLRACA